VLKNTDRKEETIGEWVIKRNIDGQDWPEVKFRADTIVKPVSKIKVWAKGTKPQNAAEGDI